MPMLRRTPLVSAQRSAEVQGRGSHMCITHYSCFCRNRFSDTCLIYAHVKEDTSTERTAICGGTGQRESHVYTSVSSTLDMSIKRSFSQEQINYFLIKYEGKNQLCLTQLDFDFGIHRCGPNIKT